MKRKDITLIIVIIFISAIFSLVISKLIFGSPQNRQQNVEVVQPITSSFAEPSKDYFNAQAIDPTKTITIGQNNNPNPFNTKGQ